MQKKSQPSGEYEIPDTHVIKKCCIINSEVNSPLLMARELMEADITGVYLG